MRSANTFGVERLRLCHAAVDQIAARVLGPGRSDASPANANDGKLEADEIVCLEDYPMFEAIGLYYHDFRQVSDEEVIEILHRFPAGKPRKSSLAGGVTRDGR